MSVRLNCPYCNAGQTVDALPLSGRVNCPRCEESYLAEAHVDPDWSSDNALSVDDAPVPPRSGSTRIVLFLLILFVLVAAGMYWLSRDEVEPPPPTLVPPPSQVTTPPKAIPGLKQLPGDVAIVAAIQPARLTAFTNNSPKLPGVADHWQTKPFLGKLVELGINLEQVNCLVIAASLSDESIIPDLFVILDLAQPLADEKHFFESLKANQFTSRSGNSYYKALLWNFPMTMDKVSETRYNFATRIEDLATMPRDDLRHLSQGVRASLEQLSPASVAWAVTDYRDWQEQPSVKALRRLQNDDELFREWNNIRALALSLSFEPEPTATIAVRGFDENAAKRFEQMLVEKLLEQKPTIRQEGEWAEARLTLSKDE